MNENDIRRIISTHYSMMPNIGGIKAAVQKTRLGNQVNIIPYASESLDCYAGPAALPVAPMSSPKLLFRKTILRVTASDLEDLSYLPGSWALTIDARPIGVVPSAAYPGDVLVTPVMAEVTLGTGAAAHTIEMDAVGNVLAIPAMDVNVDVGISQVCGLVDGNGIEPLSVGLYDNYEVRAVIHRVGGLAVTNATKTILVYSQRPLLPVPNFASSWCYVTQDALAFGDLIVSGTTTTRSGAGDVDVSQPFQAITEGIPDDIVSNNARNHCFRQYQPHTRAISIPLTDIGGGEAPVLYPGSFVNKITF